MQRLFADLVLSRQAGTAWRAGFALPASLVLHAAGLTLVVLVSILTRDTLPAVEGPAGPMPPFIRLPQEGARGPQTPPAGAPRPPRPAPPFAMAFIPDTPPEPTRDDVLDALEGPPDSVVHLPCSHDCVPVYPEIARVARVQGNVVLDCTIGVDGRVDDVKVLGGPALLQTAAVDAVRQWLYRPTLLNGVAVPVVMTVTVRFTLER